MTDPTPPPPPDLVDAVRRARDAVNHGRVPAGEWAEALADELTRRGLAIVNSPVEYEALQLRRALLREGIVVDPDAIARVVSRGVRPTRQLPEWFARVDGDDVLLCDDEGVWFTARANTRLVALLHRCAALLNDHGPGPHLEDTPDA